MTGNFSIEKQMFDSSCISDHMGCPRLFYYSWIRRLVSKEEKPSLTFGKVFHEVLLEWYKTGDVEKAEKKFDQLPSMVTMDKLTKDWGVAIFKQYVKRYAVEQGKTLHLEVKFRVEVGDRVYAGTIDRIEQWDKQIYVSDHKTSARLQLSDYSYRPSIQIDGYCYACRELLGECAGAIINGISTAQNPKERFNRFISGRSDRELDGFKTVFTDETNDILRNVERKHFPMRTSHCGKWGKCRFWELCVYGEDEKFIEQNYKVEEVKVEKGEEVKSG